jgi:hypothetical protein
MGPGVSVAAGSRNTCGGVEVGVSAGRSVGAFVAFLRAVGVAATLAGGILVGVEVGGTGVSVGGSGVAVGTKGVSVGMRDVSVGGTAVGINGVFVAVGVNVGSGVELGVGVAVG